MYLYGALDYAIDERGRIAIPAKHRHEFAGGGVVRVSAEGCVELYTLQGFEAEAERRLSAEEGTRSRSARRTRRGFLGVAYPVDLDSQGRIQLPQIVRDGAHLNGKATIVGCGEYMEIWERERWHREQAALTAEEAEEMGIEDEGDGA